MFILSFEIFIRNFVGVHSCELFMILDWKRDSLQTFVYLCCPGLIFVDIRNKYIGTDRRIIKHPRSYNFVK